jgi:hypothetical protein
MALEFQYGMFYIQIMFRDSDGYPQGQDSTPDALTNDSTTHSYLIQSPVAFTHPSPTFELVTDRGGQKIRGQADLGASAFGEGSFELTEFDDTFHAFITGGAVDSTSVSGWRQSGFNINKVARPRFKLIASMKTLEVDESTNTTSDKWIHHIYNNVQIRPVLPSGSQNGGVNPNTLTYTFVPSQDTRHVTGELFTGMSMSLEEDKDINIVMVTSNPIAVTTFIEAGTPDGMFTTAYLPLTDENTTSDKFATDEGTSTTISSCNTTTGAVAVTAADAGDRVVFTYETAFVAVP